MTAWKKCLNRYDINLVKAYDINSVRNIFPQSAFTALSAVVPLGKTLLEVLHESGEVPHAVPVSIQDLFLPCRISRCPGPLPFLLNSPDGVGVIQKCYAPENGLRIKARDRFPFGLFDVNFHAFIVLFASFRPN